MTVIDTDELLSIAALLRQKAEAGNDERIKAPLDALAAAATHVGLAASGSWFGYHSTVYYKNFEAPPPGSRFSQEWGFMRSFIGGTRGDWAELAFADVISSIEVAAGSPDLSDVEREATATAELFEDAHAKLISRLSGAVRLDADDEVLVSLLGKARALAVFTAEDFLQEARPKGQLMSRDMAAFEKGLQVPPHIAILARVFAARQPFQVCSDLSKIADRAIAHLNSSAARPNRRILPGTHIFIGHGRSAAWKDLRDFIRDRLHLPWDEFNRVPIAGVTSIARLTQMLDQSAIAFLVMTAEDEQLDGSLHARMNVIHEAGLFQGRLGFERAIVLLEEGCSEFSNIQGLGQIRFPVGNISAVFEQIRLVLEREGLAG